MARLAATSTTGIDAIAERLRLTREAMRLNQAAWCRLVGISTQTWNNYESGTRRISIDQALRLCQTTGASLDWIYRGLTAQLPFEMATQIQRMQSGEASAPARAQRARA